MIVWNRRSLRLWDLLFDALMWPRVIEILHIVLEHAIDMVLMEDEDVIKTFAPHTSKKAFTYSVCTWGMIGSSEDLDRARRCSPGESRSELSIVIVHEILGYLPIRRGFPKLLGYPGISRKLREGHMDDFARFQLDDEEGKQRAEEGIGDL